MRQNLQTVSFQLLLFSVYHCKHYKTFILLLIVLLRSYLGQCFFPPELLCLLKKQNKNSNLMRSFSCNQVQVIRQMCACELFSQFYSKNVTENTDMFLRKVLISSEKTHEWRHKRDADCLLVLELLGPKMPD